MGKGIALMFKERFPQNFRAYAVACKNEEVRVGSMFVTASEELAGPRWIINFPTKEHWRTKTKLVWIEDGLRDLQRVIQENDIRSIAIPPLGCGNGGQDWSVVRPMIERMLGELDSVEIVVFEPTSKYQNVTKPKGVEKLTPARALIAEMVRRYSILGFECSILEVQKLAWALERVIERQGLDNPLNLKFSANRYGPFAQNLTHLLNALDGSYLSSVKRLSDASPTDTIQFVESKRSKVSDYLAGTEAASFVSAIDETDKFIDGFQSPLGMEVLATVGWLLDNEGTLPTVAAIRTALKSWAGGPSAAQRKLNVFTDRLIEAALVRLREDSEAA